MKIQAAALGLLIPFSAFYITRLPLSPNYLFLLCGLVLSLLYATSRLGMTTQENRHLGQRGVKREGKVAIITSSLTILAIAYFTTTQAALNPNPSLLFGVVFSYVIFLGTYTASHGINNRTIISICEYLPRLTLPVLIFEAYYRLNNPIFFADFESKGEENLNFYFYKVNSIMFFDSNYVGILIACLISLLLYLSIYTQKRYFTEITILSILCILTLSRAAIIATLLLIAIFPVRKILYKHRLIIGFFGFFLASILISSLQEIGRQDHSFQSKFMIFDLTRKYIQAAPIYALLFGVGFGNSHHYLGIGAHNFFSIYLIESGLFGLLISITFLSWILIKTKGRAGIVIFPHLLIGLSAAPYASTYFFAILAAMLTIERRTLSKTFAAQEYIRIKISNDKRTINTFKH